MWAERISKACLILPPTGEVLTVASRLADRAVSLDKTHWVMPFAQFAAALAAYRRGQWQTSIDWCDKVLMRESEGVWFRNAQSRFIRAMALARIGNAVDARAELKTARAIFNRVQVTEESQTMLESWHDLAICDLLQKEADEAIRSSSR